MNVIPAVRRTGFQLYEAIKLAKIRDAYRLDTVPGSAFSARHLSLSAGAVIGGGRPGFEAAWKPISYNVPALADLTVDEIARVRQQSDAFQLVRGCLQQLALAASAGDAEQSVIDYQAEVTRAAADIVEPAYNQLEHKLTKARLGRVLAKSAAGKTVGLVLSVGAHAFPPLDFARGPVASGAAAAAGHRLERRAEGLGIAKKVLTSLIDEPGLG